MKKFEKYFGTHEVNRGELYIKIIEELFTLTGGKLDDQPYEVIDGVIINTKNYNRLCRFIESHQQERFELFAKPLIDRLEVFYEMFKDVANLGALKKACFNIIDEPLFQDNIDVFKTEDKKSVLAYLITQYNNSDIKNGNNHAEYFRNNILPLALVVPDNFRTTLDTKRFYDAKDKERLFFASTSFNAATNQVKCEGVMNDGVTPCGCGKWMSKDETTVDHIVPWILGGKTNDQNAQLLCRECNSRKGSNVISSILQSAGGNNG